MTLKNHHQSQADDFKNLNYTLLCLRREHEMRHQHQVDLLLSARPRERGEDLH